MKNQNLNYLLQIITHCQEILAAYIVPNGASEQTTLNKLLGILDDSFLVHQQKRIANNIHGIEPMNQDIDFGDQSYKAMQILEEIYNSKKVYLADILTPQMIHVIRGILSGKTQADKFPLGIVPDKGWEAQNTIDKETKSYNGHQSLKSSGSFDKSKDNIVVVTSEKFLEYFNKISSNTDDLKDYGGVISDGNGNQSISSGGVLGDKNISGDHMQPILADKAGNIAARASQEGSIELAANAIILLHGSEAYKAYQEYQSSKNLPVKLTSDYDDFLQRAYAIIINNPMNLNESWDRMKAEQEWLSEYKKFRAAENAPLKTVKDMDAKGQIKLAPDYKLVYENDVLFITSCNDTIPRDYTGYIARFHQGNVTIERYYDCMPGSKQMLVASNSPSVAAENGIPSVDQFYQSELDKKPSATPSNFFEQNHAQKTENIFPYPTRQQEADHLLVMAKQLLDENEEHDIALSRSFYHNFTQYALKTNLYGIQDTKEEDLSENMSQSINNTRAPEEVSSYFNWLDAYVKANSLYESWSHAKDHMSYKALNELRENADASYRSYIYHLENKGGSADVGE